MESTPKYINKLLNSFSKSNTAFTGLLVSVFFIFGLIGIANHEMWRDELQAWMIARDSSSLSDLFRNLRYEGHPGLWHSCLYFITRFTRNPIAMQFFHLLLATGVIFIFTRFSPFTRLQKLLFAFGYFPFYEYSIISRNYSLGVLLVFLFCTFFLKRNRSYLALTVIIVLMENTNIYNFIIAICFALTLVLDIIKNRNLSVFLSKNKWNLTIVSIVFILSTSLALVQMIQPPDAKFQGDKIDYSSSVPIAKKRLGETFVTIWRSYIPVPNFFKYNFWNTNIPINHFIRGSALLNICAILLSLGLLFFSMALFVQKPVVLFLYLSGTLGIMLFSYVKLLGGLRHDGHLFILFLACLWLSNFYTKSDIFSKPFKDFINSVNQNKNHYLTIILYIHVFAGSFAYTMDLMNPFSASKEVSRFIEHQELNDTLIVGSKDYAVSSIAALLDRKIYYPESDKFGSFINWNQRKTVDSQEVLNKLTELVTQKEPKALLVLNYELDAERPDLSISLLSNTSQSIVADETYYLYLVQKKLVRTELDDN